MGDEPRGMACPFPWQNAGLDAPVCTPATYLSIGTKVRFQNGLSCDGTAILRRASISGTVLV
jgi:hypothetical protein